MKAIGIRVRERPEIIYISGLDDIIRYLGGFVKFRDISENLTIAELDDDDLEFNRMLRTSEGEMIDYVLGDFVILKLNEDGLDSLTDDETNKLMRLYYMIDVVEEIDGVQYVKGI